MDDRGASCNTSPGIYLFIYLIIDLLFATSHNLVSAKWNRRLGLVFETRGLETRG